MILILVIRMSVGGHCPSVVMKYAKCMVIVFLFRNVQA